MNQWYKIEYNAVTKDDDIEVKFYADSPINAIKEFVNSLKEHNMENFSILDLYISLDDGNE